MKRGGVREALVTAFPAVIAVAYMDTIKAVTREYGFWLMLPVWLLAFLGLRVRTH
jgi:hypothetical protein